ncbi:hypothetical protein [Ferruginibacter sp. SUN106]|uniref:hypothetical protein n=1 Tax=Ferruginibacter sp. SUN106 TaxID=2978348 RepID=UPI003D3692C4
MEIFAELHRRNKLLYWFGLFNIAVGLACIMLQFIDDTQILHVSRWLKPMKFYLSVGIMVLTFDWLLFYLNNPKKIKIYSWLIVITMLFENGFILMQAIRHTTSHFNITSSFNGMVFSIMGLLILLFTIVCIFITVSFFRQKEFTIPPAYFWGIRLGLVLFLIFSIEGGMMVALLKHTVGGADGSEGLPVLNWSKKYGDLRIAHFMGIHALQVIPLLGYYVARNKNQLFLYTAIYFMFTAALFLQAIKGIPLFF